MTMVTNGMADLEVDHILPVGTDIALERNRSAHPASLVDKDSRLRIAPEHRVVAGGFQGNLVAATLPYRHRGTQRNPEIGFAAVNPGERELRVVRPALGIGHRLVAHSHERVVPAERRGIHTVFNLDGVSEHL